ncbi:translocation/assembly module TamB domain-containing protein [Blattabacterium clevelandi]|uniref:translocation/assembly module TamB domain-containing protein n=1 Tax=Blattabacterium clevelandi TaxID=164516 RepID=UPI000DE5B204|nr:translocation/assembly module TamB domain-containing protein [Blattabacterium clevelandi]
MNNCFLQKFIFQNKKIFLFCIIVLFFIIGIFYTIYYQKHTIKEKIVSFLLEKVKDHISGKIYVKNITFNILKKEFSFHDVNIIDHHKFSFVHFSKCKISIENLFQYILINSKYLNIGNLIIENPKIFVKKYFNEKENNLFYLLKEFVIKKKLSKNSIGIITCSNLKVKNAYLTYENINLKKSYRIKNFFCRFTYDPLKLKIHNFFIKTNNSFLKGKFIFYNNGYEKSFFYEKNRNIQGEIFEGSKLGIDLINLFFYTKKWSSNSMFFIQGIINGKFNKKLSFSKILIKNVYGNKIFSDKINIFYFNNKWKKIQFLKTILQISSHEIQKLTLSNFDLKFNFLKNYSKNFIYRGNLIIKKRLINLNGNIQYNNIRANIYNTCIRINDNNIQYTGEILTEKNNILKISKIPFFSSFPSGLWIFKFKGIYNNFFFKKKVKNDFYNFFTTLFFPNSESKINLNRKKNSYFQKLSINIAKYKNENRFFIKVFSFENKSLKKLSINISDIIIGHIYGNFEWNNLLKSFKNEIYCLITKKKIENNFLEKQYAYFNLFIKKSFYKFFNQQKKMKILSDNIQLSGLLKNRKIKIHFFTKTIKLNEIFIKNISIKVNSFLKEKIQLSIEKIFFKNFIFKYIDLSILDRKNYLLIYSHFFFNFQKKEVKKQTVNLIFKKINDPYKKYKENHSLIFFIIFSQLNINGYDWFIINHINKNIGKITIDLINHRGSINNLMLSSTSKEKKQKTIVINYDFIENNCNKFRFILKNIELKRIIPKRNIMIDGMTNGFCILQIKKNKIELNNMNIKINNVLIEKKVIGDFYIHSFPYKKNYKIHGILKKGSSEILFLSGNINNNLQKKSNIDLNINIQNLNMSDFSFFWKKINSEARGIVIGKIQIKGSLDNPHYFGKIEIKKFGIKINSINTDYEMINTTYIYLIHNYFILNSSPFIDTKYHTKGYINGFFLHNNFFKWNLNLSINTNKLLVLNTKKKYNTFFFGRIFSNGKIKIIKKDKDLKIYMKKGNILNSSHLYINPKGLEYKNNNFIDFINPNKTNFNKNDIQKNEIKKVENENKENKFSLNIKTYINKNTKVSILLDNNLENFIELRGQGPLFLKKNIDTNIQTSGTYFVKDGFYHFSNKEKIPILKLKKQFKIKSGGMITWTNNFNHSNINLTAYYTRYVSNVIDYLDIQNFSSTYDPIIIYTKLKMSIYGDIKNPKINLDILFPNSNEEIKKKLFKKLNSYEEKNIQFFSILTLGKFLKKNFPKKNFLSSLIYNLCLKHIENIISEISPSLNVHFDFIERKKNKYRSILSSIYYEINNRISIRSNIEFFIKKMKKEKRNLFRIKEIQLDFNLHRTKNSHLKFIIFSRFNNNLIFSHSKNKKNKTRNYDIYPLYGNEIIYRISSDFLWKKIYEFFFHKKKLHKTNKKYIEK